MARGYVFKVCYHYLEDTVTEHEEVDVDIRDSITTVEVGLCGEERNQSISVTVVLSHDIISEKKWIAENMKTLVRIFTWLLRLRSYIIPGYDPRRDKMIVHDARILVEGLAEITESEITRTEATGNKVNVMIKAYLSRRQW